jgi:hypothetical protein
MSKAMASHFRVMQQLGKKPVVQNNIQMQAA